MAETSIIDFHTHYFPENISGKAMENLGKSANIKPLGDGSLDSLVKFMKQDQVIFSINLPVATSADHVRSINRQMIENNRSVKNVLSFGSMHPDFAEVGNVREELEFIHGNGLKGIKLHPEYQNFYPDDPKMIDIYDICRKLGLIIVFHCGKDLAFDSIHATPQRMAEVAKMKNIKIVCAHMGGYQMWDDVENYLMGLEGVYFDTSYSLDMENTQMKEIILGHGAHKILFGSDFPWQRQSSVVNKIKEMDIGAQLEGLIFSYNAQWLLDV